VLEIGEITKRETKLEVRNIDGGILVQENDTSILKREHLNTVTNIVPTERDLDNMLFGVKTCEV